MLNYKKGVTSLLIILLLILSISLLFLYLRDNNQKEFLKGVDGVYILRQDRKIVFSNLDVFITNSQMDKISAKKITSGISSQTPRVVNVPFYGKEYIVIERPKGEGGYDYVVFDGDGKLIIDGLIGNSYEFKADFNIKEHDFIPNASLINLRDDGTVILKISEQNKVYSIKFDLATGKYLGKVQ